MSSSQYNTQLIDKRNHVSKSILDEQILRYGLMGVILTDGPSIEIDRLNRHLKHEISRYGSDPNFYFELKYPGSFSKLDGLLLYLVNECGCSSRKSGPLIIIQDDIQSFGNFKSFRSNFEPDKYNPFKGDKELMEAEIIKLAKSYRLETHLRTVLKKFVMISVNDWRKG